MKARTISTPIEAVSLVHFLWRSSEPILVWARYVASIHLHSVTQMLKHVYSYQSLGSWHEKRHKPVCILCCKKDSTMRKLRRQVKSHLLYAHPRSLSCDAYFNYLMKQTIYISTCPERWVSKNMQGYYSFDMQRLAGTSKVCF